MSKVCFILIDALRSDYISKENTPFLYKFANENKYYKNIIQSRSFCERAEIFSGLSPKESGYFTAIGYDPNNSPFKNINKFLYLFDYIDPLIPKNRIFDIYKSQFNKLIKKFYKGMSIYSIPLSFAKYFALTEDQYDFRSKEAFDGKDNIFKDCKNNDLNIFYDSFTALNFTTYSNDDQKLQMVVDNIKENYNLYLVYQGLIDISGHKYGPNTSSLNRELKNIDKKLEKFYNEIITKDPNCKFIFLGDHGMTTVKKTIDIETIVSDISKKHNLKNGKDFIYFLDSTMFRIWYFNDNAKQLFANTLKQDSILTSEGYFLTEKIANKEEIPFNDRRYGDDLWLANTGVLVFPDFFHKSKPYKGMHGYDVNDDSSKGTCMISNNKSEVYKEAKLTDVYNFIKKELGIN